MKLSQDILCLEERVIQHRRWFHRHPEIGFELENTKQYIINQLIEFSFDEISVMAQTGIKAVMKGKNPTKTLAFRADMDALSLHEATNVDYSSCVHGLMHGCGHDGHMALLLGFAEWISKNRNSLKDNIVLIFQPAEESEGGALPMIQEGVLTNPQIDAIFGIHIFPEIPQGKFGVMPGPIMAQTSEFDVEIFGKSAHGAMPHKGIDALRAANQFLVSLQGIINHGIDPYENALISIGKMEAGERRNIIPEKVKIEGIIRTFDDIIYSTIKEGIQKLLKGIEISYGVTTKFKEIVYYPVVQNDEGITKKIINIIDENLLYTIKPQMIAEDFSYYQREVPGVFLFLGCKNEAQEYIHPLHSSKFNFDEKILLYGIQLYTEIIQKVDI